MFSKKRNKEEINTINIKHIKTIIVLVIVVIILVVCLIISPLRSRDGKLKSNKGAIPEIEMIFVEGGCFLMGCTEEQGIDCYEDESPCHEVTLDDFYIGKFEITQSQWETIMGNNPSRFKGYNHPVEQVSWNDVNLFIDRLNEFTGKSYRLPTEAEWEYAARGGNNSGCGYDTTDNGSNVVTWGAIGVQQSRYSGSNYLDEIAWYNMNSEEKTHPVGQLKPNSLGIYDMTGNVYEWCHDCYDRYLPNFQNNPSGATTGGDRVYRGGGWRSNDRRLRVSYRYSDDPDVIYHALGFRLAADKL